MDSFLEQYTNDQISRISVIKESLHLLSELLKKSSLNMPTNFRNVKQYRMNSLPITSRFNPKDSSNVPRFEYKLEQTSRKTQN